MSKLSKYNKKRDFSKTKEPKGSESKSSKRLKFCVQHHIATTDHYDLRLEYDGVLLSWAIPKGPSYNPKDKRLAVKVEDHPLDYINFEGTIPQGQYGGGTVMLFDKGYYKLIKYSEKEIKFNVYGERLKGKWVLTKLKDNNYLLIKEIDYFTNYIDINKFKRSIKTNRLMEEITNNSKTNNITITSKDKKVDKYTKEDIVSYYKMISNKMLPYIQNRVISVIRCPDGNLDNTFFKKHLENKDNLLYEVIINKEKYYAILDKYGLINEVEMNSFEFHIMGSNASTNKYPNMLVFDLDPDESLDLSVVRNCAKNLKKILDKVNLISFLKTSGGKGYHIVVPINKKITWKKIETIASNITNILVNSNPLIYTTNIRKRKRTGKILIDYYRNKFGSSTVAPYSVRLRKNLPISMPISWKDLDKIKPNEVNIKNVKKYLNKKDPWKDFFTVN